MRHKHGAQSVSPAKIRTMLTSVEPYPGPFSKLLSAIESPVTMTCGYNRLSGSKGVDLTGDCDILARSPGQEVVRMYVRESNSKTPSPTVGAPGRVAWKNMSLWVAISQLMGQARPTPLYYQAQERVHLGNLSGLLMPFCSTL
jgi:hypothetical protein